MKEFLTHAAHQYYEGTPVISDQEFDKLSGIFGYDNVGHTITDGTPHMYQMYSLQKFFSLDDAPDLGVYISSPKLDGAAVSLLYVSGKFVMGLTRGDGKIGRDVTDKLQHLVPEIIDIDETVQITGEIVSPKSIPNSRNYASGALNLKDMDEFLSRDVTFVAYDMTPNLFTYWHGTMEHLNDHGFTTVIDVEDDKYPTDGEVFRIDNVVQYYAKGVTAHHPRGAFALKEQKDGVVTKLLDVKWQVGKSGVVSPVAILEPVLIGDAEVGRATLHNIDYIRELELEIGCNVEVIRSGEIIPRVVRRV